MAPAEPTCRFFSPMPAGYEFVPKGNVYITAQCRKRTHEAGRTLFVVLDKHKKPLGLRCPKEIFDAVEGDNRATAATRSAAVQARDALVSKDFEAGLLKSFPKIPKEHVAKIVQHALRKGSGRVGRTSTIELDKKVGLAVRAHIRHMLTDYEQLLKDGTSRDDARGLVFKQVDKIARAWMGRPKTVSSEKPAKAKRKVTTELRSVRPSVPGASRMQPRRASRTRISARSARIVLVNDEDSELGETSEEDVFAFLDDDPDDSDWQPS